ncbi:hypothetical protein KP509_03G053300 [Ceratopteris richardii]|uniref:Uncharacterized protein n=1 Tax=Ceratopteris richardii TaxID=49495 RepID=A0A8T2UZV8_CERRI|nr:hypothetical protein KP509_03G053300 [Ceratopteris richardii]
MAGFLISPALGYLQTHSERGNSRRFAAVIIVAASCLCLSALALLTSYFCPIQRKSIDLCRTPSYPYSKADDSRLLATSVGGSVSPQNVITATNLSHVVFGIAASSELWEKRKEYLKLWWKPKKMRGFVWLEKKVRYTEEDAKTLPPQMLSADTMRFKYTSRLGRRSGIRISRIVSEMYRLGLPDVRWFVMSDDDTIFVAKNLLRVLSKYDHKQFYYIGSNSESHMQNLAFSYNMAYGGGGFAISYPLAKALSSMQDDCLHRYPSLVGSDDRIHACMAELGVPLTKEPGFHQYDIRGNALGLLAAHPLTPAISLHHLDAINPVFPNRTTLEALNHLQRSIDEDPTHFLQQSICYEKDRIWSISISWGYVVQIFRGVIEPRELEVPLRTFYSWNRKADFTTFAFNARAYPRHPCERPTLFYMHNITTSSRQERPRVESFYIRDAATSSPCPWTMPSPTSIDLIKVSRHKDENMWNKAIEENVF